MQGSAGHSGVAGAVAFPELHLMDQIPLNAGKGLRGENRG